MLSLDSIEPLFSTCISNSSAFMVAMKFTKPLSGVYLKAFDSKLITVFSITFLSYQTCLKWSILTEYVMLFCLAKCWNEDVMDFNSDDKSPCETFNFKLPDSNLERSNNWSTKFNNRLELRCIISKSSLSFLLKRSESNFFSKGAEISVKGVRNSWEMFAKKLDFKLSISFNFLLIFWRLRYKKKKKSPVNEVKPKPAKSKLRWFFFCCSTNSFWEVNKTIFCSFFSVWYLVSKSWKIFAFSFLVRLSIKLWYCCEKL